MAHGAIHTRHRHGYWINEVEDYGLVAGRFSSRAHAVAIGREHARHRETEHVIHEEDGTIGERHSYARDVARPV